MRANDAFHIAVVGGDGIGPEVMAPALEMLKKIEATTPGLKFRFSDAPAGAGFVLDHHRPTKESFGGFGDQPAGDIGAAAWRLAYDDLNRL